MSFRPREVSKALIAARTRVAAMQEIDRSEGAAVEYGTAKKPLNTTVLTAKIEETENLMLAYNEALAKAGEIGNEHEKAEETLADLTSAVLSSAKTLFGKDASQVETLGGTRASERKRAGKAATSTKAKSASS